MKLFPNKHLTIKLSNNRLSTLNELKQNTKLTDRLVSEQTDKEFIGQVSNNGFKIISSEIGRGAVCVFVGELQDSIGNLEIRLHKAFKVMFLILMIMPIGGFVFNASTNGIQNSIGMLVPMFIGILFVRFILMELSFRFISKTGLNKLNRLIGLKIK